MSSSKINHKRSYDIDYHTDNLKTLISSAKNLPNYLESTVSTSNQSSYSISSYKRSKLFLWVIELLDLFTHQCQNSSNCQYRCDSTCQSPCMIRCSDRCKKPRVLSPKTRQMTFLLIDSFLFRAKVKDMDLQLLATAAFFVVTKIEESFKITLEDVCLIGGGIYTLEEIASMELEILRVVRWNLHLPTPSEITSNLLMIFDIPNEINSEMLLKNIDSYIEFCILEHELNRFGMITISLTSILFALQKMDALALGEQLVMAIYQLFNLNKDYICDCFVLTSQIINEQARVKNESAKECKVEDKLTSDRKDNWEEGLAYKRSDQGEKISADKMNIQGPPLGGCRDGKMEIINEKTDYSGYKYSSKQYDDYLECQSPCLELAQTNRNQLHNRN